MIKPSGANVLVRIHQGSDTSAGGIVLPERNRCIRIGTVLSAGPDSVLEADDTVVVSEMGRTKLEDGLILIDESLIYCKIFEFDRRPAAIYAFANRLIVLVDPLIDREKMIPERTRMMAYKTGRDNTLRKATVLSAGPFDDGSRTATPWKKGDRVWVWPEVHHALQVLPHDKDLPFVTVPEGQEIRVYKPDLETVSGHLAVQGFIEDETKARGPIWEQIGDADMVGGR